MALSKIMFELDLSFLVCLAKAIYDYEACSDEELSFPEGAIINVITKDDNGVDDGWWKGELNGKIGVFPGLVVEELGSKPKIPDSPMVSSNLGRRRFSN